MVGTFNGNPLAMAAARAMLYRGATPEAYRADRRAARARGRPGIEREIAAPRPAGARGVRGRQGLRRVLRRAGPRLPRLPRHRRPLSQAHWLFQHNGGVFLPPWGKIEQWLMSVQHDEPDVDRLVENFGGSRRRSAHERRANPACTYVLRRKALRGVTAEEYGNL